MREKFHSYFYMALGMALCGSSTVAGKLLCQGLPVFLSQGISLALAVPFLFAVRALRKPVDTFCRRDIFLIILQGLTGTFLFRIFLLFGLKSMSASVSGIILGSTPAMLALLSVIILSERPGVKTIAGVVLSFGAVLCVQRFEGGTTIQGALLVLAAVVCEALMTIFRKKMGTGVSALTNASLVLAVGLVFFLPISIYEGITFDWVTLQAKDIIMAVYYGLGVSALAYLCWFRGIENIEGSTAAVFTGAAPVSAVLLSALFGEPLRWVYLLALGLLSGAVYLISRNQPPRPATNGSKTKI